MDPWSQWVAQTFWTHICPGFQLTPLCSSVLARSPTCRTLRSVQDPLPGSPQLLLAQIPNLCQKLLQIVHHLFSHQTHVPQTIQASQAASHSQEAMEFHSVDFIEKLPKSSSYMSILVIVDRLSKQLLFIPTYDMIMSQQLAQLFVLHVFSKHGVPSHITSDHGSEFVSHFFWSLGTALDMKLHFTSGYHPEGDSQTERTNQTLEQYLHVYCNYQQDNWSSLLTLAEFAYNNTPSATTSTTPFFANKWYHPNITVHPE